MLRYLCDSLLALFVDFAALTLFLLHFVFEFVVELAMALNLLLHVADDFDAVDETFVALVELFDCDYNLQRVASMERNCWVKNII